MRLRSSVIGEQHGLVQVDALRRGGQVEDDQAEPVAAGGGVLFEQPLVGERRQQAVGGRLGDAEPAGEIGHAPLAFGRA